jgi:hypothetical protein
LGQSESQPVGSEALLALTQAKGSDAVKLAKRLPADQIGGVPTASLLSSKPQWVPIEAPEVASVLFTRHREAVFEAIKAIPDLKEKMKGQGARDEVFAEAARLGQRCPSTVEAFVDPETNRVIIRERLGDPLPDGVQLQFDETRSAQLAGKLPVEGSDPVAISKLRDMLTTSLPTDAIEILSRSNTAFVLNSTESHGPSEHAKKLIGHDAAQRLADCGGDDSFGAYVPILNQLSVDTFRPEMNGEPQFRTVVTHEAMHAVDAALGKEGKFWSETGDWKAIYNRTLEHSEQDDGSLAFPNAYSRLSAHEFFAECATMYLGHHIESAASVDIVTTRDDLRRTNPDAYAFMERFFAETLPAANKREAAVTPGYSVAAARDRAQEAKQASDTSPSFANHWRTGLLELTVAQLTGDQADFEAAKEAAAKARQSLRGAGIVKEFLGLLSKHRHVAQLDQAIQAGLDRCEQATRDRKKAEFAPRKGASHSPVRSQR